MDSEEIKLYLTNIEESLFDEKKIVTYSGLSRTLGIHCNLSKQLLHTFVESSVRKEELSVTYLLIGVPNERDTCQMLVIKDKDLKTVEGRMKSISSKHIYSIQKCKELNDINVLYTILDDDSGDAISKWVSSIDFNPKERDKEVLDKLKYKALPSPAVKPLVTKQLAPANKPKSSLNEVNSTDSRCELKVETDSTSENKKAVVPLLFNRGVLPKKNATKQVLPNNKKPQGIGAFFVKTGNKPTTNEPKKVDNGTKVKTEVEVENKAKVETMVKVPEKLGLSKENIITSNTGICEEEKSKNKKDANANGPGLESKRPDRTKITSKKASKSKGNKKKTKKNIEKDQKKRKRLVVLSESESNNSSEDEVEREPTPEPQPTVIPDDDVIYGTPDPSNKRKKRKLISRTYKSEDGFMVTEKSYEEVMVSEDEIEIPEKKFKGNPAANNSNIKTTIKSSNNKTSSPKVVKQSSLTSFFKKK